MASGILLQDALAIQSMRGSGFEALAGPVLASIKKGRSFVAALEEAGKPLPGFVACMLRAGESSARLGEAVSQAAEWLKEDQRIRGKIAAALAYPVIVIVILEAALAFILSYCVPLTRGIYASLSAKTPQGFELSSAALIVAIALIAALLALAAIACLAPRLLKNGARLKIALDACMEGLPLVGKLVSLRRLQRVCAMMASLLGSGLAIERALAIVAPISGSTRLDRALRDAKARALKGQSIACAFAGDGAVGELRLWLGMAEAGADPAAAFSRLAKKFKDDFERGAEKALALAEPLLSASVGALVMAAVAMFVLPLLGVYNELLG
jgi:type II secretory pathway component PulF